MITRKQLNESDARTAMETGEFDPSVRASSRNVAIVLTQDWCPQWTSMSGYLSELAQRADSDVPEIEVYELEYNLVDYSSEFMRFKETTFANALIPYLRYYREGELVGESNYVGKDGFLSHFTDE